MRHATLFSLIIIVLMAIPATAKECQPGAVQVVAGTAGYVMHRVVCTPICENAKDTLGLTANAGKATVGAVAWTANKVLCTPICENAKDILGLTVNTGKVAAGATLISARQILCVSPIKNLVGAAKITKCILFGWCK